MVLSSTQKNTRRCVPPFGNAPAGVRLESENFLIPGFAFNFPGGGSVHHRNSPPGRARGIDALHNEPAACGCDVEDGDGYQCEDRDLVELVAEPGSEVLGRAYVVSRGKIVVIKC